jgi:hypothetical protein
VNTALNLRGMQIKFSVLGVDEVLSVLMNLPPEVVSKRGGPVKTAVFKAARYVRDEERIALQRSLDVRREKGLSTGLLLANVVSRRSKYLVSGKGERYVVKISRKAYPRKDNTLTGSKPSTLKSAHIMEYGSKKQTATPFIMPAFNRSKEGAFKIMVDELDIGIAKVIKKLSRKPRKRRA